MPSGRNLTLMAASERAVSESVPASVVIETVLSSDRTSALVQAERTTVERKIQRMDFRINE